MVKLPSADHRRLHHNLPQSFPANTPEILWFCFYSSLTLPVSFNLWVIKPQRLDHKQTNLFLWLQREFRFIWCKTSVPCHLPLEHLHWARETSLAQLHPGPCCLHCTPWHMEEKSLSHLGGGAGPQDLQAKSVTLTVSNMLLQRHNSFQGKAAIRRVIWELYMQFWYWTEK